MSINTLKKIILPIVIILICTGIYLYIVFIVEDINYKFKNSSADTIVLLVPDKNINASGLDTKIMDPWISNAWKNIASEEGLHLIIVKDDDFHTLLLSHHYKLPIAGVILPDLIHQDIQLTLATDLRKYVKSGGKLMLVFDAATVYRDKSDDNRAPFSDMVGVDYALYKDLGLNAIASGYVGANKNTLDSVGIPPGKFISQTPSANSDNNGNDNFLAISSYRYGALTYYYFVTKNLQSDVKLLLTTPANQLIASERFYGNGSVLFVNLPLGYLWYSTDSMLLHAFLHYFAYNTLHLPILSAVPNGVGGLVMNVHVESNVSLPAFAILKQYGVFNQSPYSIDITAGPDAHINGDNLGLDVPHNLATQNWIRYLIQAGETIGSDGGWNHDYYGWYASEYNQAEFQQYLTWNIQALEAITGKKILEYVPPMGTQPSWSIDYLANQGVIGYYSTSNTGAPPTRNFFYDRYDPEGMWSFPILIYGKDASFEEFSRHHVPLTEIQNWLLDATNFVANHHTMRLIYYHPPGPMNFRNAIPGGINYMDAMTAWLNLAKQLAAEHKFSWYTMADTAQFLNNRMLVDWTVHDVNGERIIAATHPDSLQSQAWLISKAGCQQPHITQGTGVVNQDDDTWIIVAGDVKKIEFTCNLL